MRELRGRYALITGAASGIGRAIALELARHGVHLFLLDIQEQDLDAVAEQARGLGVQAHGCRCDVGDQAQIDQAVDASLQAFPHIDLLVNNAGVLHYGETHAMTQPQWDRIISVNLLAPLRFIQLLLPHMRRLGDAHILNVSSVTAFAPKRRLAAYQTTKAALVNLSQSLRIEYAGDGIGVTALCPGLVKTGLFTRAAREGRVTNTLRVPLSWTVSPEYIAVKAVKAIRRDQGIMVTPLSANLLWRLERVSPLILEIHRTFLRGRRRRRKERKARTATASSTINAQDPTPLAK